MLAQSRDKETTIAKKIYKYLHLLAILLFLRYISTCSQL